MLRASLRARGLGKPSASVKLASAIASAPPTAPANAALVSRIRLVQGSAQVSILSDDLALCRSHRHYNSFATEFFCPLGDAISSLLSYDAEAFSLNEQVCAELKGGEPRCHRCGRAGRVAKQHFEGDFMAHVRECGEVAHART